MLGILLLILLLCVVEAGMVVIVDIGEIIVGIGGDIR